jgi:hypothetical protein
MSRCFVKVEYVGGPWDGKLDVRDWPLDDDRVRVPLPNMGASITEPPYDASGFRVGEYRCDRSPHLEEMFDIQHIADILVARSRLPVREMAAIALERKRPVIFKWEGE